MHRVGWQVFGDKYIDGMAVAEKIGLRLKARVPALPNLRADRRLTELALE